jgi:hypothetical protein
MLILYNIEKIKEMKSTCGIRLSDERNSRRLWHRNQQIRQRLLRKALCMQTLGSELMTTPLNDIVFNLFAPFFTWSFHTHPSIERASQN